MTDPYVYYNNNDRKSSQQQRNPNDDWFGGINTTNNVQNEATNNFGWDQQNFNNLQASPPQTAYPNYYAQPNMFIPTIPNEQDKSFAEEDFENEPPLLEELGINFDHIRLKTLAVLNPLGGASTDVISDQDLSGPLVFCLLFGASLLLHGKIHFGYIYGIGLVGCTGMYTLLNLMAQERSITFTNTASILGYCLLPMSLLSLLAAVLSLQGLFGYIIVVLAVFWSGTSSSKLFSIALSMNGQRFLVSLIQRICGLSPLASLSTIYPHSILLTICIHLISASLFNLQIVISLSNNLLFYYFHSQS